MRATPPDPRLTAAWAGAVGHPPPPAKDLEGCLNAAFAEWLMGLPPAADLPRAARIRLAGNAVAANQGRLMLQRELTATEGARKETAGELHQRLRRTPPPRYPGYK